MLSARRMTGGQDRCRTQTDDEGLTDAEKLLRRLTEETGGAYWKRGNATSCRRSTSGIDQLETSEIKTAVLYHAEISPLIQ